jgi:hypothetical protein
MENLHVITLVMILEIMGEHHYRSGSQIFKPHFNIFGERFRELGVMVENSCFKPSGVNFFPDKFW